MEFTAEQQAVIDQMIADATTKATEGLFNKEQLEGEVSKKIQSETDKVRTEYTKKLKTVEDELQRYKPAEKSEEQKQYEARLKAMENELKAEREAKKLLEIRDSLKSNGLPAEFAKYVAKAEDVESSIKEISEVFQKLSADNAYKPTGHSQNNNMTKKDFKKLSYTERERLYETNPTLYEKLSK